MGSGGDVDVVVIGDQIVDAVAGSVGVDEERRVDQEVGHDRSSSRMTPRTRRGARPRATLSGSDDRRARNADSRIGSLTGDRLEPGVEMASIKGVLPNVSAYVAGNVNGEVLAELAVVPGTCWVMRMASRLGAASEHQ